MIVLCVMNCPPGLRGDLSKWLNEVNTGVYVGSLNARVRDLNDFSFSFLGAVSRS